MSIAYPFAPVSSEAVGGMEQVLSSLDQALVTTGNTSIVVACEGSQCAGELFTSPLLDHRDHDWTRNQFQAAIYRALRVHDVDVIHMHGFDFYKYSVPSSIPLLVTLHMPITWYPDEAWREFGTKAQFCCVSESQRRTCPPALAECSVVENGVTLSLSCAADPTRDYALVMGRICPEKNAHEALQAGALAGIPVLLGGQVFPYLEHRCYFREKIEPLLQSERIGPRHEFVGPLRTAQKQELLRGAKCLLHPTLAPETSSLVAMEALAAGTPVIAYLSGALPEIVEDGITGFLVDSVQEMAEAIGKVHTLSRDACLRSAQRRFSKERMVQSYFDIYDILLETQQTVLISA